MKIKNWDKWQTFRKDRGNPQWIKVHRNLMTNPEWVILSDAEKGQLISMWIIASSKNGVISDDSRMIQKMAMLDDAPNLNKFIDLGFLEGQPGNQAVTKRLPSGSPRVEKSREEKSIKCLVSKKDHFDTWWAKWPKKVEKKKARAIWKRRKLDRIAEIIIRDTEIRPTACAKWKAGYICNPTTYLNGDRWEDEYETDRRSISRETALQRSDRIADEQRERIIGGH